MDIHLEDRLNHLLFSLVQLHFSLPALVFFHMGISLKKKEKKKTPKASKCDFIALNSQQNVQGLQWSYVSWKTGFQSGTMGSQK